MKQVFSVLSVTCVAFFTLFLSTTNVACKKGDTGPKGDTGVAGPQGPAGVANIIYSGWLNVQYSLVTPDPQDPTQNYYAANIAAPKITDDILAKGEVRVYINVNTAAQPNILTLPFGYELIPIIGKGSILLQAGDDSWGTYTQSGNTYQQYRYVIIPGGVAARSAVNWNDYNSVKQYLNLAD